MLAAQLLELGKMRVEGEGPSLGQALAAAVPLMYTRLSEMVGREEMEVVKAVLEVRGPLPIQSHPDFFYFFYYYLFYKSHSVGNSLCLA